MSVYLLNNLINSSLSARNDYETLKELDIPIAFKHNFITYEDVKRAVEKEKSPFRFVDNGIFKNVSYAFMTKDLYDAFFDDPSTLEYRGLVFFNKKLVSRPYARSFNYGELKDRFEFQLSSLDESRIIYTEKLDGYLIQAFSYDGVVYYSSRNKIDSYYATRARNFGYTDMITDLGALGYTCIFEYLSPDHPISIRYPEESLILHGIRSINSGLLLEYSLLKTISGMYDVPLVKEITDIDEYLDQEVEGVVMHYPGNNFDLVIKRKTEFYNKYYKIFASIRGVGHKNYRPMIGCMINGTLPEVIPYLSQDEKTYVKRIQKYLFNLLEDRYSEYIKKDMHFPDDNSLSLDEFNRLFFKNFPEKIVADLGKWLTNERSTPKIVPKTLNFNKQNTYKKLTSFFGEMDK